MNILSIDYGTKRLGLAKWNSDVDVILPFGVAKNIDEIVDLVNKENFDKIVVGMPYSSQDKNASSTNMDRVNNFISKLKEMTGKAIDIFDERFSSQQADRMGGQASRDEKSAMIILQSYLDSQR